MTRRYMPKGAARCRPRPPALHTVTPLHAALHSLLRGGSSHVCASAALATAPPPRNQSAALTSSSDDAVLRTSHSEAAPSTRTRSTTMERAGSVSTSSHSSTSSSSSSGGSVVDVGSRAPQQPQQQQQQQLTVETAAASIAAYTPDLADAVSDLLLSRRNGRFASELSAIAAAAGAEASSNPAAAAEAPQAAVQILTAAQTMHRGRRSRAHASLEQEAPILLQHVARLLQPASSELDQTQCAAIAALLPRLGASPDDAAPVLTLVLGRSLELLDEATAHGSVEPAAYTAIVALLQVVAHYAGHEVPSRWLAAASELMAAYAPRMSDGQVASTLLALQLLQGNTRCELDEHIMGVVFERALELRAAGRFRVHHASRASSAMLRLRPPPLELAAYLADPGDDAVAAISDVEQLIDLLDANSAIYSAMVSAAPGGGTSALAHRSPVLRDVPEAQHSDTSIQSPRPVPVIVQTLLTELQTPPRRQLKAQLLIKALCAAAALPLPQAQGIELAKYLLSNGAMRTLFVAADSMTAAQALHALVALRVPQQICDNAAAAALGQAARERKRPSDIPSNLALLAAAGVAKADARDEAVCRHTAALCARAEKRGAQVPAAAWADLLCGLAGLRTTWQSSLRARRGTAAVAQIVTALPDLPPRALPAVAVNVAALRLATTVRSSFIVALEAALPRAALSTLTAADLVTLLDAAAQLVSKETPAHIGLGRAARRESQVPPAAALSSLPPSAAPMVLVERIASQLNPAQVPLSLLPRLVSSLASLEVLPSVSTPVLYHVVGVLDNELPRLDADGTARFLGALATFSQDIRLPASFMRRLEAHVLSHVPTLDAEQLTKIAASWPTIAAVAARAAWPPNNVVIRSVFLLRGAQVLEQLQSPYDALQLTRALVADFDRGMLAGDEDRGQGRQGGHRGAALTREGTIFRDAVSAYVTDKWDDLVPRQRQFGIKMCRIAGVSMAVKPADSGRRV